MSNHEATVSVFTACNVKQLRATPYEILADLGGEFRAMVVHRTAGPGIKEYLQMIDAEMERRRDLGIE